VLTAIPSEVNESNQLAPVVRADVTQASLQNGSEVELSVTGPRLAVERIQLSVRNRWR